MESVLKRAFKSDKEIKAFKEMMKVAMENKLSFAEIKGAAWEAQFMLMNLPLKVVESQNNKDI